MRRWLGLSILIVISDQVLKLIATNNLYIGESVPVINNIFHLTLVHNTGAAFGILKGAGLFFIITSFAAGVLIFFNMRSASFRSKALYYKISLSLILAGAAGNLIDRLRFGYVIDFLDFRVWPVFNLADSSITVGAVFLLVSLFKKAKPQ